MTEPSFTVCVLGYADYNWHFTRCLTPIYRRLPVTHIGEIRIGLNDPSDILAKLAGIYETVTPTLTSVIAAHGSPAKYPMMRRLLYERPIETEFVMWFDDDSFIRDDAAKDFFGDVREFMQDKDLIGSSYSIRLRQGQAAWIKAQPWYTGKQAPNVDVPGVVNFFTGGWWVARTAKLIEWDYPWPTLHHNGGDVMLGQLAYQQGWRTAKYNTGVAINADRQGNESRSQRRGLNTLPIGATA